MQESVVHKKERPLILETWRKHPVSKTTKVLFYLLIFSSDMIVLSKGERGRERGSFITLRKR